MIDLSSNKPIQSIRTEGEKEGGLAAVALTMGEAKVNGRQGGLEDTAGS